VDVGWSRRYPTPSSRSTMSCSSKCFCIKSYWSRNKRKSAPPRRAVLNRNQNSLVWPRISTWPSREGNEEKRSASVPWLGFWRPDRNRSHPALSGEDETSRRRLRFRRSLIPSLGRAQMASGGPALEPLVDREYPQID
jgi:hypothetical protein